MTATATFTIWKGYQSPYSLGLAFATAADPIPESIDLLNDDFTVNEKGGMSSWIPTITAPKDGVWADSQTQDGRQLLIKPMANATETFELVCGNRYTANAALSTLNRFGQAARDFWADMSSDPVYVEWAAEGGVGSQWALIYNIEASFIEAETLRDSASTEPIIVSVSFEREPAWRGIPFGVSPKIWAMAEYRGLKPTTTNPAPVGFYGYDNLDLGAGSGNYAPLVTKTLYRGDELGTVATNYIDVDASLIPGDAPALCQVTVNCVSMNLVDSLTEVFLAASRRYDYFPSNNSAGGLANARQRMSYNAGDATTIGDINNVVTKIILSDGYLSNGSIVNRYVGQCAFGIGTTAGVVASFSWQRRAAQISGSYMVFMRHTLVSGTASVISAQFQAGGGGVYGATPFVTLNATVAARRGGLLYLGNITFPELYRGAINGTGVDSVTDINFSLHFAKTGGATHTLYVWEVVLVPLNVGVVNTTLSAQEIAWYDSTGYLASGMVTGTTGTPVTKAVTGQDLELMPNVDNRVYVLLGSGGSGYDVNPNITAYVDIVPRWYGIRDR